MIFDRNLLDFPKFEGEKDDSPRFARAIAACENGVLYVPKGVYDIASPIKISNFCSLEMHPAAVLKAVKEMDFVLTYDGGEFFKYLVIPGKDGGIFDNLNLFIRGGDIDGAGLASCLKIANYHHFTLKDIALHNGKKYGLYTGAGFGYELIASNVYAKTIIPGLGGNCAFCSDLSDSHFTDCIAVDYTVGFRLNSSGNRLTRCHVWGGIVKPERGFTQKSWCELYYNRRYDIEGYTDQSKWSAEGNLPEMLKNSVCFDISGGNNLDGCYADTAKIGFLLRGDAYLNSCGAFNNYRFGLNDCVVIEQTGGRAYLTNCVFYKWSPGTRLYRGKGSVFALQTNACGFDERFPSPEKGE